MALGSRLLDTTSSVVPLAASACAAVLFMLACWVVTSDAIDIAGMDMNVVYTIQQILLGHPPYQPTGEAPYAITQYTPLYYYFSAAVAKSFGISGEDVIGVTRAARAFSVFVAVMLSVVCYRFLRSRVAAGGRVSLVATVFIMLATSHWYFGARPDGLATLFTILCFYFLTADNRSGTWPVVAAAFCAVAAVLSKQTGLFALLVGGVFLVSQRAWRSLAVASCTVVAASIAVWLAAPVTGSAIKANVIDGIDNGISMLQVSVLLAYGPFYYWFAPVIAASLAVVPWLVGRSTSGTARLLAIAVPLSFAVSMISALKTGSAENYFNEFIILGVLAVVCAFVSAPEGERELRPAGRLATIVNVYLLLFLTVRTGHQVYTTYLYHRSDPQTRLPSQQPPAAWVRRHLEPGRHAIGFAVGLSNALPERMLLPHKELALHAFRRGLVDYSRFRQDVESGKVQFAIVRNGEPLPPYLDARFDNFQPVRRFRYYTVYSLRHD